MKNLIGFAIAHASLAIQGLLGARRAKCAAVPRSPVSQPHEKLRPCQWNGQSTYCAATAAGEEYDDSSYVSPPFTSEDIEAPPDAKIRNVNVLKTRYISLSQAQHDPGVQSREDWEREKYADRIAALLYTSPDTPPKKQDPKTVLYGKNKADKILISQLLKDRGQTSYDWRIPLLQLERYYKPSDSKATFEAEGQFRKIESCDPLRRVYLEPLRAPILARDVPEPTSWSEKSVFNYLADVTETQTFQDRIPKVLKPQHRDWSNVKDIADIIFHLFRRSETRRCLTVDACNIALRFFYDHGMFTRARAMYVRMEAMRMDISTETFNIILRSAARHRDLHNFTFLLHHTIQRGLKPDETTWVSLLMAVPSTAVRAIILHKMREKNMLEKPGIATDVAALMVQHDLTFHLGNGHNFDEFLDHMDLRYGVRWLSTSAGNSLLNESSKRRPALETLDLLDGLKLRGFIPDETSMDILLRKCLPLKKYADVIKILHAFQGQFDLRPGSLVFETLLTNAWSSRMLNFSRVVWRLACISGFTTSRMRRLVFRSILAEVKPERESSRLVRNINRSQAFNKLAGKFVIGVCAPRKAGLAELNQFISPSKATLNKSELNRARVDAYMKSDLLASRKFRTKTAAVKLLRQALDLDRKWAAQGLWKMGGRHPDLQHGVQIDVETRSKKGRGYEAKENTEASPFVSRTL